MSESVNHDATEHNEPNISRRRALQVAAATGAAAAAGGSVGLASAQVGLDFESDLVQRPRLINTTVEIARHVPDSMEVLQYVNDAGDVEDLRDYGAEIKPRDDADPDVDGPIAHNPVTINASSIGATDYRKFPRGETYTDADGNEQDLDVVDAQHWTTSGASLTTVDGPNGEDALQVTGGDTDTATFTDFELGSGELRRHIQIVADVADLSGSLDLILKDSASNTVTVTFDTAADASAATTVTTSTGTGIVYQAQIGDLVSSMDTLTEIELSISGGSVDATLVGLNVEKESRWSFGEQEFVNADDEIETSTIYEPSGDVSITTLSSLGSALSGEPINDLGLDVEVTATELGSDDVAHEFVETDVYDQPWRFRQLFNFEIPSAYDLNWSLGDMVDHVLLPESRYVEAGVATGQSDDVTLDEIANDDVSLTSRTSTYGSASIDSEITLTSSASVGSTTAVYVETLLTESQKSDAESTSGGGAAVAVGGGGGSFWSSPRNVLLALAGVVGAALAAARSWI